MNMGYKKRIFQISFLAILGIGAGIFMANLGDMGLCGSKFCRKILEDAVGVPLALLSLSLLPISSLLYFLREEVFCSWFSFARWYLSLAAIAIFLSLSSHGGWGVGNIFDTELVTMWSAGLFFLTSLFLIAIKSWKLRKIPNA